MGAGFFHCWGLLCGARNKKTLKERIFTVRHAQSPIEKKKKLCKKAHKGEPTTAPPLSPVFPVDREGKGRRAAMSQAESAPLGSVAAKVEVVGSGIGWCAAPGPLFFLFFSFLLKKTGTGAASAREGRQQGRRTRVSACAPNYTCPHVVVSRRWRVFF